MELTRKQDRARTAGDYARVIAGPGSGKTTLLVARAAYLLENPGTRLAMVTFAKAAAWEMKARLEAHTDADRVMVATFDAFARRQAKPLLGGYRPPRPFEKQLLVSRAIREANVAFDVDTATSIIEALSARLDHSRTSGENRRLYEAYCRLMDDDGVMDFAQLAKRCVEWLGDGTVAPLGVDHILIDEFQDTSEVQMAWAKEHWRRGIGMTVVGDDDQSIYGFRQALGYTGMEYFRGETGAQDYMLDDCFRCSPQVIRASQTLIRSNLGRLDKTIRSKAPAGGTVMLRESASALDEVAEAVTWAKGVLGTGEKTLAVLCRTNQSLDLYEAELKGEGVPVRRIGGSSLWDQAGAGVVLNLAEAVSSRRAEDAVSVINALAWKGVDDQLCQRYRRLMDNQGLFVEPEGDPELDEAGVSEFAQMFTLWAHLCVERQDKAVLNAIFSWVAAQTDRSMDIRTAAVARDVLAPGDGSTDTLAMRVARIRQQGGKAQENEAGVCDLLTLHAAKGMEWDAVWMGRCNEGVIPSSQAMDAEFEGDTHMIEEERRLFYVGMTRARRLLVMGCTGDESSRFVGETGLEPDVVPADRAEAVYAQGVDS